MDAERQRRRRWADMDRLGGIVFLLYSYESCFAHCTPPERPFTHTALLSCNPPRIKRENRLFVRAKIFVVWRTPLTKLSVVRLLPKAQQPFCVKLQAALVGSLSALGADQLQVSQTQQLPDRGWRSDPDPTSGCWSAQRAPAGRRCRPYERSRNPVPKRRPGSCRCCRQGACRSAVGSTLLDVVG